MSESVLKSFVVKLGFKINDQQFRNFNEGLLKISKGTVDLLKNFRALGEATALSTTAIGASLVAVAKPLEGMYYMAKRTGASAKELDIFTFAMKQIGISAEESQGAIESLAAARRQNPGLDGQLTGMGIKPGADNAKVMMALLNTLIRMPSHYVAARIGSNFGISEKLLQQITDNNQEFAAAVKERTDMIAKSGYDPEAMAREGVLFMRNFNHLAAAVSDVAKRISTSIMPVAKPVMKFLSDIATALGQVDKATSGWSTRLIAIGLALRTFAASLSLIGRITGISSLLGGLGRAAGLGTATAGGAEAAGGAALAEGGAAAGGAGLLATIGLPVIVAAAVTAALVYMALHPEQVRKAAGAVYDAAKGAAGKVAAAAKNEAGALPGQLHTAGAAVGSFAHQVKSAGVGNTLTALAGVPGVIGSLATMVANFEGHVRGGYGTYKDLGGRITAGFGHLVQKGEDFTHLDKQGALALLAKDLQTAAASVAGMVKVKLSKNQQDALSDFVFNVGKGNLAKSTLLKKLNSGDFAGAANEFKRYNKVLLHGHYVVNQGLANRRAAEAKLFSTPDKSGVQIKQETNIHVTGGDAKSTGREVAQQQSRVNGDMVRNFASAVQ